MRPPLALETSRPPRAIVLIPVFNHAPTLRGVVEDCLRAGHPVLVVDDGSTDNSLDTINDLPIARHSLQEHRGRGAAIQAGAAIAASLGYSAVITLNADGQHDPADAKRLLEAATGVWPSVALGVRPINTANEATSGHHPGRAFANFCLRLECGRSLPDNQSGFSLYPVDLLTRRFISRRNTFDTEVLVRGAWAGLPIVPLPITGSYPTTKKSVSRCHSAMDKLRLVALHAWLVILSLTPWHHRRPSVEREAGMTPPSLLHPIRFFRQLCLEHSSPGELAAAVWVGIFIGALPIIPFGIATIVYVCHRLHLNKLAGAGASNVCVAPFVPFLCIEAGHFLRYGQWWTTFTWQTLVNEIHVRLWEWLLGSLIVGPILGILGALLTYMLVRPLRVR